jgi:hypothetical protein
MVWLLAVELQLREPKADGGCASTTPSIKLSCLSLDLGGDALVLSLPSHRGGGEEEKLPSDVVFGGSTEWQSGAGVLLRAQYMVTKFVAVIFGQQGDPSSTSSSKALWFICCSSTLLEGQVVRPRSSGG